MIEKVEREMTFGEMAVGFTFNLSNDEHVQAIKEAYAAIIDAINGLLEMPQLIMK